MTKLFLGIIICFICFLASSFLNDRPLQNVQMEKDTPIGLEGIKETLEERENI